MIQKIIVLLVLGLLSASQLQAQSQSLDQRLLLASPDMIAADDALSARVNELAEPAIASHCAECHGTNLQGQPGVPDLTDWNWLWGITGEETTSVEPVYAIMQTILYGIRNQDCSDDIKRYGACPDTRFSQMPGYAQVWDEQRLSDLTELVLDMGGQEADAEAVQRAQDLWPVCTECHGEDGWGHVPFGGPNLRDDVWLYGDSREVVYDVIANGREGQCPAWHDTLDYVTVKALAVYIYRGYTGM